MELAAMVKSTVTSAKKTYRTHLFLAALIVALTGGQLTGCATMRRHPAVTGLVVGAAAGTAVALSLRHNCPNTYDGKPYQGTPPCPK